MHQKVTQKPTCQETSEYQKAFVLVYEIGYQVFH